MERGLNKFILSKRGLIGRDYLRGGLKENLRCPSKVHNLFYNLLGVKNILIQNANPPILMTN